MFGVNDYPWANAPFEGDDKYGYAIRQCASFANWRCVNDLGLKPDLGGNGGTWGADAAAKGFPVDGTPQQRDIMCLRPGVDGAGQYGHVAVVLNILNNGAAVWVEDYNWADDGKYRQHQLPVANGQFIHAGGDDMLPAGFWQGLAVLLSAATLQRTREGDGTPGSNLDAAVAGDLAANPDDFIKQVHNVTQSAEFGNLQALVRWLEANATDGAGHVDPHKLAAAIGAQGGAGVTMDQVRAEIAKALQAGAAGA